MKRVSIAKTPSSVCGLISPPELVTMNVRPWLIVMPGGATLISIGIVLSLGDHHGCPYMLFYLDESQDCSGRSAIALLDLEWQADQFVYSRFYPRKIESLDNPDTSLKQSVMGLDPICEETADREIINADGLHLLYCEVACRFLRDVDEILHKVIGLPTPGRIPRLEDDSLTALNLVWAQLLQFN